MKILFAASEAGPFIKTGGLGDVMGALPQALVELEADVRVILPKYKNIKEEYLNKMEFVKSFIVPVGWRNQYCGIFKYEHKGVIYYFIDNEYYFNRSELYGHYDDGERFAFFDRAVLKAIKELEWAPDVIHCNDWHTGMIPVMHKVEYSNDLFYSKIKTFFSIHNLAFKGNFDPNILPDLFGYDFSMMANGSLEFHGGASFLKGALNYSDQLMTVSRTYADEIQTPEGGDGLDGILRARSCVFKGTVNGIDYDEFNPETDKLIYKTYNFDNLQNKVQNKLRLQRELGLPQKENVPMLGLVSRLTNQKGCDLIINIIDRLLQKDIQVVILGTGDKLFEETFTNLQARYPDKISANIKFDNGLAHKVYAASDIFLMPSLFEPCGLGQLIAMRYGTVPIVREIGGLKDTVYPYNQYNGIGNGFGFRNYSAKELLDVTEYAISLYHEKSTWKSIVRQAMESDNSWQRSAKEYMDLYEGVVNRI